MNTITRNENIHHFFDNFFELKNRVSRLTPAVNISENENAYYIDLQVPNIDKNSLKISAENSILLIAAEVPEKSDQLGRTYHRQEIPSGKVSRSFELPDLVDIEKISAEYNDGILSLQLPKLESAKPRNIEIKLK